jgi:heme exporter protein D
MMTHLPYVLAAYAAAGLTLGGLVAWVALDTRIQKRRLTRIEARDGRRTARPER